MRLAAVVGVFGLLSGLVAACSPCPIIDYTVPPPLAVLGPADAVVLATVDGIRGVGDGRIEAEINVIDVLFSDPAIDPPSADELRVGAYDDPCSRRSGLALTDGSSVLVVLRWIGVDNGTWSVPWRAYPVLLQNEDGTVTFLDTGENLNQRIDEIMPAPTVEGLIEAVSRPD